MFVKRLSVFLPHVASCLNQQQLEGRGSKGDSGEDKMGLEKDNGMEENEEEEEDEAEKDDDDALLAERREEEVDRLLFSALTTLSKMLHHCDVLWTTECASMMSTIWGKIQSGFLCQIKCNKLAM